MSHKVFPCDPLEKSKPGQTARIRRLTANPSFTPAFYLPHHVVDFLAPGSHCRNTVNSGTPLDFNDIGPNQPGESGSGIEHYYDTGTFNLSVDSECDWALKVVEAN